MTVADPQIHRCNIDRETVNCRNCGLAMDWNLRSTHLWTLRQLIAEIRTLLNRLSLLFVIWVLSAHMFVGN